MTGHENTETIKTTLRKFATEILPQLDANDRAKLYTHKGMEFGGIVVWFDGDNENRLYGIDTTLDHHDNDDSLDI